MYDEEESVALRRQVIFRNIVIAAIPIAIAIATIVFFVNEKLHVSQTVTDEQIREQVKLPSAIYEKVEQGRIRSLALSDLQHRYYIGGDTVQAVGVINGYSIETDHIFIKKRQDGWPECSKNVEFSRSDEGWTYSIPWKETDNYSAQEIETCMVAAIARLGKAYRVMQLRGELRHYDRLTAEEREASWKTKERT